jgi:hypothetical protein
MRRIAAVIMRLVARRVTMVSEHGSMSAIQTAAQSEGGPGLLNKKNHGHQTQRKKWRKMNKITYWIHGVQCHTPMCDLVHVFKVLNLLDKKGACSLLKDDVQQLT